MQRALRILLGTLATLIVGAASFAVYTNHIANPAVLRELRENPQGERAALVMILELPSGKEIPINYLRETIDDDGGGRTTLVYAGADGVWWEELRGDGAAVGMLIRGESLRGHARAIENDPDYTLEIFKRLRPASYKYLGGTLVEIRVLKHAA